ncbi:MAG: histidine kinase [Tannerella sp.]|jgi:sensor histidine kinase YesM|nr:histidine kinase [Tannerella sp.]
MNRRYVYIYLVAAVILTLILVVPELVTRLYGANYFGHAEWYHDSPARHHFPPVRRQAPAFDGWLPFPSFNSYLHTAKNLVFFFVMSFALLMYNTFRLYTKDRRVAKKTNRTLMYLILEDMLLGLLFFVLYTFLDDRPFHKPDGILMLKCAVTAMVSYLFVYILLLIRHRQQVMLENEQLNTQNIQVQYEALAGQVNPHFLFNSLNTLSSLIREHQDENALKYINKLSDIFRYVIYADSRSIKTLREELEIIDAYRYLLQIRYEDNLLMNIRIDEKYKPYLLPNLSLQLLLENTVNHNEVSADKPLIIDIYTTGDDRIAVSNLIRQKWDNNSDRHGIGLKNLNRRYQLLFSKDIVVENNGERFTVRLPLINENSGL